MKNIFNTSKRRIIVILTLSILLGIAGTWMNVTAMVEETTVATEEITTVSVVEAPTISTEESTIATEETAQELMPMMASRCSSYVIFNDKMANSVAQYHGYAGAEAFKRDYGVTSNANMYRNTVNGEIVLITNTGAIINTGLYGGW